MKNATLGVNFRAHFRTDKAGLNCFALKAKTIASKMVKPMRAPIK